MLAIGHVVWTLALSDVPSGNFTSGVILNVGHLWLNRWDSYRVDRWSICN